MNAWTRSILRTVLAALATPIAVRAQETAAPSCASPSPGVVPSCTATERLQDLSATLSTFTAPAGTVITTSAGNGVEGNAARNWTLLNQGSIAGFTGGVSLSSLVNGGAIFENFGSVVGNGGVGVAMSKGGTLTNHEAASIISTRDGVSMSQAGAVINYGWIRGASTGTNNTSVYFALGGSFTQSASGEIAGVHGVLFNAGTLGGSNAGAIDVTGNGLWARANSTGSFSHTGTISTTGAFGTKMGAARVQGGASLTLTGGGSLSATGNGAYGIYANNTGTRVNATDLRVNSGTGASTGVFAENGASITLTGGSVTTSADAARGMVAFWNYSSLTANNVAVTTTGDEALGVRASGAGLGLGIDTVTLNGGSVSTDGTFSYALLATTFDTLTANNVTVTTRGERSGGASSQNSGILEFNGGSVVTSGASAAGLSSLGIQGEATLTSPDPDPVEVVEEAWDAPSGVFTSVSTNPGSSLVATGVSVTTSGADAPGASVRGPSSITLIDSTVSALGTGAAALSSTPFRTLGASTATISNATLTSAQSAGIDVNGTTLDATLEASTLSGATALSQSAGGGILNLIADSSTLSGIAQTDAGSETHYTMRDATTWNLGGDSTLTSLVLDDAMVNYGGAFGLAGAVSLESGGGTFDTKGFDATLAQPLGGAGALTKRGDGTLTLTADSTNAGGAVINGGTLQLGAGGTAGNVTGPIAVNGTLVYFRSTAPLDLSSPLSGNGVVRFRGVGVSAESSYRFEGIDSTFTGTFIAESDARFHVDSAAQVETASIFVENDATLFVSTSDTLSSPLFLSGDGWSDGGAGRLGALRMSSNAHVSGPVTLTGDARVTAFAPGDSGTISGSVTDGGHGYRLEKTGNGTVILTGALSVASTTISRGTLQVGDGAAVGSVSGSIVNDAALVFDRSDAIAYGGAISGSGTLTQAGTGSLTLSGINSYAGLTTVAAGQLRVDGSVAGDVLVNSATLGGSGTIGGGVTINDTGHLAPGNSVGTVHTGSLLMNAGSLLDYELGLANRPGGNENDLTVVNGNLTLDGVLNIADAAGFGAREVSAPGTYGSAVYRLFDYSGSLTDAGLEIGAVPDGFSFGNFVIDTATPGQVNLNVLTGGAVQFWDGADLSADGVVNGGTAVWTPTVSDWTNAAGAYNGDWQGGFAVFAGTAGTVLLGADISFAGMVFVADGYRIAPGAFALQSTASNTLMRVGSGSATIDASIAGTTRLVKTGAGLLALGGANDFSGGTFVDGGALQVSADRALGVAGTQLALDDGTLITTGTFASTRDVSLGMDGGTFQTEAGTGLTLSGAISGAGELRKTGAGELVLDGVNSHAGGTILAAGILRASTDAAFGLATSALEFEGGTLALGASFDPVASRPISLDGVGGGIDTNGFDTTLTQSVGGAGALTKLGAGTLTLAADNTYAGGTTIEGGTLRIGAGGTTGSVIGDIANDGALVFERSDVSVFRGIVSGNGDLEKHGAGLLVMTSDHTYTGGTTISGGALQLGNGGSAGSVMGDIANNGALIVYRADDLALEGVVSGTGTLAHLGQGTLTLLGANTFTGETRIATGGLQVGNGGTRGALVGNVVNNGTLIFNRGDALGYSGVVSGAGSVTKAGAGTLILAADQTYTGGTTLDSGTLQLGNGGTSGSLLGNVANNGALIFNRSDSVTHAGVVSGTGSLAQAGTGVLTLTSNQIYTGGTTIGAGTLQLGNGGTEGGIAGNVVNNGALIFNRGNALTYAGVVSGAGSVTQAGMAVLTFTANQSYTGGTTISAGTLQLGSGGAEGGIAGNVANHGALIFNRGDALTYAGAVSGTGSLTQAGTGTLILTGNHSYTGDTTISGGTLQLGNGGVTGNIIGDVINNGALAFNRGDDLDFTGTITGGGGVVKMAAGTLTLSGISNYTGATRVDAGRLQIAGSLISDVSVAAGATLGGNGVVGAVTNLGTVAPGASIGTLQVSGDFSQQPAAILQIEFDDQGHIDALDIAGAASLGGEVAYLPDPASAFGEDLLYTYLTAAGGVSGTFGPVVQDHAGVLFETVYTADQVHLRIDSVPIIDRIVTPGGADLIACVASLDSQRSVVRGTRAASSLNALVMTPVAALPATVHGICPRDPSALPSAVDAQIDARFGVLANRLAELNPAEEGATGMLDAYELRDGVNFWFRGAYLDGAENARDLLRTGYDSHSDSLAMGIDFALNENAVLGGYLVRDDLDLDYRAPQFVGGDSAQAEDRAWSTGIYGSYWSPSRWFLQGILEYGWHELESTRTMALGLTAASAEGKRDARAFAANVGAGYNFEPGRNWLLQPTLALSYHRLADDAYTESGADSLDLSYSSLNADTLRGEAGITARRAIVSSSTRDITTFYAFANYVYDLPLDDRNRSASFAIAEVFEIVGDERARDGIHYGLGFENTWHGDTSIQLVIDAQRYGEIETLGASLQFRRQF